VKATVRLICEILYCGSHQAISERLVLEANCRLHISRNGVDSTLRSEFLKLRRWSLGFRRWT